MLRLLTLTGILLAAAQQHGQAGAVLSLYYDGIKGGSVRQILSDGRFPGSPTLAEPLVAGLARADRGGDNWGSWTRGYVEAPQTGEYTFLLASDDHSEFWLSPTHEPFEVRKLVENTNSVARNPRATSQPVSLVRGGKYYFELYHKEGTGEDHIRVAWRLPDGTLENPVAGHRLSPVPVDVRYQAIEKAPEFLSKYFGQPVTALTNVEAMSGTIVLLAPSVQASQPVTFQWFRNDQPIAGEQLSSLTIANLQLSQSGERYSLVASNGLGIAKSDAVLTVASDRLAPEMLSAVNGSAPNSITIFFSESLDPGTVISQNFELIPPVGIIRTELLSAQSVLLHTAPLREGKTYRVKARGIRDASGQNTIKEGATLVVDAGLLAWLRFDSKDTNDLVRDLSGNYNAAVLMNGAKLSSDGVFGSSLELDGVDDHAMLPAGFKTFTNGMTVTLWAKPTKNAHWARFIDFGNGPFAENIVIARVLKTSNLIFETHRPVRKTAKAIVPEALENDRWQHLAVVMDKTGNVSFYKDGKLAGEGVSKVPPEVDRTINLIGKSNWDADEPYQGLMDDLRIYERALAPGEVQAIAIKEIR